jgi:transketolase
MAQALRYRSIDSRVVVILGDGETNEGQIWEAAAWAPNRGLANLMAIIDRNGVQVDGRTAEILNMEPLRDKWQAFGWRVVEVDGHNLAALCETFESFDAHRMANPEGRPTAIIAKTVAGRGISFIEGMAEWHIGYLHGPDRDDALAEIRATIPSQTTAGVS